MIKAVNATEGLPTLSVIEYKYGEETCHESKSIIGDATSCSRSPIIEGDEVTDAPCNIIE